jgi:hypothetical protein
MFNAPNAGVNIFGHVGWAYQVVGTQNWTFGATENGPSIIAPEQSIVGWYTTGTFSECTETFANGLTLEGISFHSEDYYTQYRCIATPLTSLSAALYEVEILFDTYDAVLNNCLTKSILIFQAYSSSLDSLNPGLGLGPNYYFTNYLTGFGAIQQL